MPKRFTDSDKWIKNKWFRKLSNENKLLWLFLLDNCDAVGVWEEDIEFVTLMLGTKYSLDKVLEVLGSRVHVFRSGKKWWIKDFIPFQYGILNEQNCFGTNSKNEHYIKNKPHYSYINLLRKHSLWEDYLKTIDSLKEKNKETEQDEDKEKEKEKEKETKKCESKKKFAEHVSLTESEFEKLVKEYGKDSTLRFIEKLDNYKGSNGKEYKSDYRAILNWVTEEILKNQKNQNPETIPEMYNHFYPGGSND